MSPSRRDFLKTSLAGLAAGSFSGSARAQGEMPYRMLGSTGERVSLLTLGGAHIGYDPVSEEESIRIMHAAIDGGINFFDNSWDYNRGRSEERMGKALAMDNRRKEVFLMTKFCCHSQGWTVKDALRMLEQSLTRLQTDHLDLWQIHEVIQPEHPDLAFRQESAIEALEAAKKEGKIRFAGFTGHRDPAIHLEMLSHDYPFDTVQMPLNVLDAQFRSFEQQVLPVLLERKIGVIGMKPLGGGSRTSRIVATGAVGAEECLRYAMSLPVSTVCTGMPSMEVLEQNLRVARSFEPLTLSQREELLSRTARVASNGEHESYKTG